MIEIDGSYGSGGGQILRTACALSVVTKKPCHVFNVRRGREKPGLMPQHLLGIQALARLCNGRLEGDYLNSEEIKFYPGETYRDRVSVNIPTAGSITLVLQSLIPPALFAPGPIKISFNGGATDTFFSPNIDHFRYCFLKILEMIGCKIEINVLKRGYYPEGGAKAEVTISPSKLKSLNLMKRGPLKKILIISGASEFLKDKKVAERQLAGVREILGKLKLPLEERVEYYDTRCPGSQICLIAEFENTVIGTDNLGKLGKRAEDVGKEVALELLKEQKSEACLDKHLADQILPYLALAKNESQVTVSEITNHCKTNIWVIEKFINGKFKIEGNLISWLPK
ncbi:MAG: RNA 3'-terminal phosphate cyclase [Patescibacteria group bacterium]|nr:RNA 3'-terminal phosphate cyclase [Patescibacteria group bacterium]